MTPKELIEIAAKHGRLDDLNETIDQVSEALESLNSGEPIRIPWPTVDRLSGGLPVGSVVYVGAFSGHGKSTFLMNLLNEYFENTDLSVYYMGLESRPYELRTLWACLRLGLDPGSIMSKDYRKWPNATEVRIALEQEFNDQRENIKKFGQIKFSGVKHIDAKSLFRAGEDAAQFGADIFIVDHVDHIEGLPGQNDYAVMTQINSALLSVTQKHQFVTLAATQFNLDALKSGRVGANLPPKATYVYMGNKKRHIATAMYGLYRPLKPDIDWKEVELYNKTGEGYLKIIEPNTMGIVCMKNRLYGSREGQKVFLTLDKGRVIDRGDLDSGSHIHGIKTNRDY